MSHGHSPESHGSHHEPAPEPDRISIPDPGEDFVVLRKEAGKWITTHQGPNGDFYTIANDSTPEANMTLYNEDKRNEKLKDAVANGLYRVNDQETAFRPAPSDHEHPFIAATGLGEHEYGVSDKFKNKDRMSADTLNKIGSRAFISTGRGKTGSNEKQAIQERSASIVLSYQARDKALAEGKTPEEAQEIGAQVYLEQEEHKQTSRVSPGLNIQPEARHAAIKGDKTINETTTSDYLAESDERIDRKERFLTAKWFAKTGRNALMGFRVIKKTGIKTAATYYSSKLGDVIENSANYAVSKLGDIIEDGAERSVDAVKAAYARQAEALLQDVNSAVSSAVDTYNSARTTIETVPKRVAYEYRTAIRELGDNMLKVSNMWLEHRKNVKREVNGRANSIRHYTATPPATPIT